MDSSRSLSIVLKLQDQFSGALKGVSEQISKQQKTFDKIGQAGQQLSQVGTTLSTRVTAPIVAFGAAALKVAGDFELAMNNVRAVSGATGDQFERLNTQAKDLGRTTQYTAAQAAEAMGFLAMAGFKADEIFSAMPGTLELAASAQLDLGRAADIVSNVLTGYGLEVSELSRVNDVLVKSFTSANTDLSQLGDAFKYAGPVAKGAGIAFEETAAALSLMGNGGIQASMAGTSLRMAVVRLLNPTSEVTKALDELGISSEELTDGKGGLKPLADILEILEKRGANTSQVMSIFGVRAGPAMGVLLSQGTEALRDLTGELENAGGTASEIAAVQMEGFIGAMRQARSAFEGFMIALAESGFMETVADLLVKVAEKLIALAKWWENLNPKMQEAIVNFTLIVAAIGPILFIGGQLLITIAAFGKAFALIAPVVKAAGVAIGAISAPIAIAIAALVAIAAVVVWWINNWDENIETLKWIWEGFTSFFTEKLTLIKDFWVSVWENISSVATTVVTAIYNFLKEWFVDKPVTAIKTAWEALTGFFKDLWGGIIGTFENAIQKVTSVVDKIVAAARRARDAARDVASAAGSRVRDAVSSVGNAVGRIIGVNDAIISPKGDIITTHPDDYLIATKNPHSLGGGGVTVNVYGDVSGMELVDKVKTVLAREIGLDIKY